MGNINIMLKITDNTDHTMTEKKRDVPIDKLTKEEAARLLNVSVHTVTDFIKRGRLQGEFIKGQGFTKFFNIQDVLRLKREREQS